ERPARPVRRREEVSVDLPASRKPVEIERPIRREEEGTELSIDLPVRRRAWKDEVYPPEPAQETHSGKKKMIRDASAKTKNHRRDAEPVRKTAAERKTAGKVSAGKTSAEKMSAEKVPVDEETFDRSTKNTGESVRPADGLQVSVSPKHSPSRGDAGKRPAFDGEREKKDADRRMAQAAQERIRRKKKKGGFFGILLGLFLFVSVIFAVGYVYTQGKLDLIQRLPWNRSNIANTGLSADTMARMKGYWTVAVFGVDSRDSNLGKGTNADVNMIVSINHDTGDIRLVSVYRDTYMKVSDKVYNKLNAAYQSGGPESSVWALNRNLDVNIDDYVTFNWKAVAQAINILGGIDVEITKDEFFYINAFISETVEATGIGSHQLKEAGMNHLDGVQAVAYGRLRLMDSDFKRTERQRTVIQLALEKMKKADLSTLNSLVETVFPEVATSADVSDALRMAANVGHYHIAGSYGFPENNKLSRVKGRGSVVAPATLASNVTLLHKFLFDVDDYAPSETVQAISKHVSEVTNVAEMKEKTKEEAKTAGEKAENVSAKTAAVQETSAARAAETNKTASSSGQTSAKAASTVKQTSAKAASTAKQTSAKAATTVKQTSAKAASTSKQTANKTSSASKTKTQKAASKTQQTAKTAKSAKKTA
ncbi:transcriptional attenuator, LytR family, partial [[Clostridium] aminophilum]